MDALQELRAALREMNLTAEDLDLEYDTDNDCLVLIRRSKDYQSPDLNPDAVQAAFFHGQGADNPLARWLVNQVRQLTPEKLAPSP